MAGYLKFKYDTKKLKLKKPEITIYPIVCWHIGAEESDTRFIKEHIARIKADPTARVVYLGDGGECVTRNSKGDVFAQTMSPQQQQEALIKLLTPIKDKLLFGVRGNHGHRVYKETGLDFDNSLCNALGIPYMGVCTFCNILVNRSSYDLYFHHGLDSGVSPQTKVSSAEKFTKFIDADAIFTAHSHYATELMPALIRRCDNSACKITDRSRKQYICGSAYDSRTGYAEDKGYPPLTPAHISVTLDGRIIEGAGVKKQTYRKYE